MFNQEKNEPDLYEGKMKKNELKESNSGRRLEIIISENLPEINIDEEDILKSKKRIDNVLDKEWDLTEEKIQIGIFADREELEDFAQKRSIPLEKLTRDSALFYINSDTQEKYVFVIKSFEENKKELEDAGCSENEAISFLKKNILAGVSHEMTHMHPFFEKHGNQETKNLWEQEMICSYIEGKTRGDISEKLREWGYLDEEKIERFSLNDGDWESFSKEEKNAVLNYFYPFLIKEYGLENVREIWKILQVNPDIGKAIQEAIKINSEEIANEFKEKIKDREYLKNIFN
jgi:hypothetical protein